MAAVSKILLNTFLFLLFLQWAPSLIKNLRETYQDILEPKTKVGLISIHGCLDDATTHAKNLRKFFHDTEIKGIVIKMDCPGGASGASQALFHEIKELKKQRMKPVITWVQNVCASGGYYIACATDHIIATPSALVGSIGAYIPNPSFKKFIEQFKINYNTINAGTYKTAGNPLLELTPEQATMFKGLVDDIYQQFTHDVILQRPKLSSAEIKQWADGRVFTGAQALRLGLIDELGSQITAERAMKEKIGTDHEIEWVHPTCKSNLMKLLTSDECEESDEPNSYISAAVKGICAYIDTSWHGNARL